MAFAHLTIATRDVRGTVGFFGRTLGWTEIDRPNNIPMEAAWLAIGPGQELHLVHLPDFAPSPFEREYGRHFAVFHPLSEFPGLKQRLRDAGVEPIGPIPETPYERFFFRDLNGYMFEVVAEGFASL